jgi:hypothetical protein
MTVAVAGNIKDGVTIADVAGNLTVESHSDCAVDGAVGCVTTADFKAADMTVAVAGNIKDGVTIADVAGNLTAESHSDCATDGATGCVATNDYKAVDMTKLVEGVVKNGVTIAGVLGDYPSADYPLTGASLVVNDLDDTTFNAKVKSATQFEYFDSAGAHYTGNGDADILAANVADGIDVFGTEGTADLESHSDCTMDGAVGCVTTADFKAADMTVAVAGNIKNGVTIADVAGNLTVESHSDCATDGATGCVATTDYKAVDMTKLVEGVVKKGVSIAGVTGDYPSATYNLSGSTAVADLLQTTFESQAAGGGELEWFSSTGDRKYRAAGSTNITASNIKSGVTIFGVTGNLTVESHSDCATDGATGCVATADYKAVDMTKLVEGNVKDGVTIAGVTGDYPSYTYPLTADTAVADLDHGTFEAKLAGSTEFEWFDRGGGRKYRASGDTDLTAANIKSGVSIWGVTGNLSVESHSDCASDGATGCVATTDYKAVDMTKLVEGNVKKGVSIAGVTGDYPSADYPLPGYDSNVINLYEGSFETRIVSNSAFQWFDYTGVRKFRDPGGDSDIIASNIKSGVTIFGVVGSLTTESHSDCAADGATGCVATADYKAVDMTKLTAANVKKNVSIAGVTGNYPSSTYPLPGENPSVDTLTTANFNSKVTGSGYFEWWGPDGTHMWLTTGDTDIVAGNIKSGANIFGVAGNVTVESHNDCSSDAQVGCITTASYKAANMTNVTAGNVKDGVVIAGITGDYPSSTYPLSGASATADLDSATFNAKVKASTSFEYWNSAGVRQTGAGDADITAAKIKLNVNIFGTIGTYVGEAPDPWDIRTGASINGVSGNLKLNCRNTIVSDRYNYDGSANSIPDVGTTAGTTNDWWDTLEEYNDNRAFPAMNFPAGWTSDNYCDADNFLDLTSDGACDTSGDECIMLDRIQNLMFSETIPSGTEYTWPQAVAYCANLVHGGYSDWRLPTQKELMSAFVHGIRELRTGDGAPDIDEFAHVSMDNQFWSATTVYSTSASEMGIHARMVHLGTGYSTGFLKTDDRWVICVR